MRTVRRFLFRSTLCPLTRILFWLAQFGLFLEFSFYQWNFGAFKGVWWLFRPCRLRWFPFYSFPGDFTDEEAFPKRLPVTLKTGIGKYAERVPKEFMKPSFFLFFLNHRTLLAWSSPLGMWLTGSQRIPGNHFASEWELKPGPRCFQVCFTLSVSECELSWRSAALAGKGPCAGLARSEVRVSGSEDCQSCLESGMPVIQEPYDWTNILLMWKNGLLN